MQYKVISPLQHDGRTFQPGVLIDLPEKDAAPLLASQTIERTAKPFTAKLHPILRDGKE
ncbi:MAG: hypothetical protein HKUEN07_12910 [Rhodocyclaceae bacterium]|jgi:hypothetical protein|uniref:Uncharacterized protein n=1 Tax=Candidatus Desulfobacillus denitrificans TaxID=2608985 RepID=A0A809QYG9_9PROT|nr:hypothetical protein [Rhodocyclaceae bacterium]MCL4723929.1 hypothetical protein [Rhodocyclaceae bacterium]BBO20449.1 hypothetical protein DSYM_11480 [Candidatus Desulfobacillus denitrificans]GIK44479.1 MAG: hypothetical protein BroJett012_03820 [Betaproteobacteria bacterium]GJQ54722.1 MAG: hypothetical protein HKUEN07_12910 [Rhodocyclaceae bacterium]